MEVKAAKMTTLHFSERIGQNTQNKSKTIYIQDMILIMNTDGKSFHITDPLSDDKLANGG